MDKMKQEIKGKLNYWRRICALFFTILALTYLWNHFRPINGGEDFADFFLGFQLGITVTFLICAVTNMMRYQKILKDEEAVRSFYIREHDERCAAIQAKSGGMALYTCGILIVGASVVAGYFSPVVFASLLSCGVFLLFVKKGLGIYYDKTM